MRRPFHHTVTHRITVNSVGEYVQKGGYVEGVNSSYQIKKSRIWGVRRCLE